MMGTFQENCERKERIRQDLESRVRVAAVHVLRAEKLAAAMMIQEPDLKDCNAQTIISAIVSAGLAQMEARFTALLRGIEAGEGRAHHAQG